MGSSASYPWPVVSQETRQHLDIGNFLGWIKVTITHGLVSIDCRQRTGDCDGKAL